MEAIANTAHLSNLPLGGAFPISPINNDEDEASFAWADDETLESLPSTRTTASRDDDLSIVTQQAIQLLDLYVYRDPIQDLQELYKQEDIHVHFQERSLHDNLHNFTFTCPLRGSQFHSSLPLPLFGNEPNDLLVSISEKVIGKYEIFHNGVYFGSKSSAIRATALAVLERMNDDNNNNNNNIHNSFIMYPSPQEALLRLGQLSPTSVALPLGVHTKKRYFPAWVHELCRVGITGNNDLEIMYQEQRVTTSNDEDVAWKDQPTLLSCIVSVKTLVELTAVGLPSETQTQALESAIGLLVEELQRQLPNLEEGEPPSTAQLKRVIDCDPMNAYYIYPLPKWATGSMPLAKELVSNNPDERRQLYLYELELKSNQGHALFGIVLPYDPEPQSETSLVFETEFCIPGKKSDDTVTVRLHKLETALDLSKLSQSQVEWRILWMKHFSGMAMQVVKANDVETPSRDAMTFRRSYFIVPLTRTGFSSARRSAVDWKMLRHVWQQNEKTTSKPSSSFKWNDVFLVILGLLFFVALILSEQVKQQSGLALILFLLILMVCTLLVHLPAKYPEPSPFQQKMMQFFKVFMPLLEREIEVANFASQLCDMTCRIRADTLSVGTTLKLPYEGSTALPASVKQATTLVPSVTYQRLEFLGDSVLGFFLSINLMGMNCSLEWDSDELARILSASANNRALGDAALRSGISRLLFGERQLSSTGRNSVVNSLLSIDGIPTGNVADHVLSDVVESLLGAAYLDGNDATRDPSGGRMVIALLEHFHLPLPNRGTKSGLPFFQAAGPCVKSGYAFNQDKAWRRQLVQIGTTLYCEHEVINRLETGWLKLMGSIFGLSSFDRHRFLMEKQKSKILLLCSLFNDSLSDEESFRRMDSSFTSASTFESDLSSNPDSTVTPESGLIRIALLRDSLFMVGHSGLNLAITEELYKMYPDASEADLSLLRTCATSDDVMAYIMVKSGLHQSLYHHNTTSEKRFVSEMGAAEDLGRKVWNRRFGWILKGGKHEYARRCSSLSFPMPQGLPRYCGLAGGRFYGHQFKLPESLTDDLVFSMKAIAGALVLSLGLEGMWQSLGPLFGELLLLSADELRKEYGK